MTADAKVGLLLGLFFIVIIAFLVNGLPNFIQEENTSPPNASITIPAGPDMVLDNGVSDAVHRLYPPRHAKQRITQPPQETVVLDSSSGSIQHVEIPDLVPRQQAPVTTQNTAPAAVPTVAETPKAHVVKSGENLAVIAKLYYKEHGNRRIVIQKLYEANGGVLKSPDRVCVGQKLTIPLLEELLDPSGGVVKAPDSSEGLLKRFTGFLERTGEKDTPSVREYIVQKGDNLWNISEQLLGSGNRYPDIIKFNKGKIQSASELHEGLRLNVPPQ